SGRVAGGRAAPAPRLRRARGLGAASFAVVPGVSGRPGVVHHALVVLASATPAVRGVRAVRAAVRRVPLRCGIRAGTGCPPGLSGLRLADDGAAAVGAADTGRPVAAVALAPRADAGPGRGESLTCANTSSYFPMCWNTAPTKATAPAPARAAC